MTIIPHPEVVDTSIWDLVLHPVEGGIVAGTVLLLQEMQVRGQNVCHTVGHLHEVGEVGHPAELIQVRRGKMFGFKHLASFRDFRADLKF